MFSVSIFKKGNSDNFNRELNIKTINLCKKIDQYKLDNNKLRNKYKSTLVRA